MKVLILTGGGISNRSGGVGTMIASLHEEWGDTVAVQVIDTRGEGGVVRGVAVFARATLRFLAVRGVDVVHLHMTTRGSMARKCLLLALCSLMRRPAVVHMHGADFEDFHASLNPMWRGLLALALRQAAHVVVLGEGWRRFLVQRVGIDAARVSVVRNGVRRPPPRACQADGPPHLLFLGRLGDRKGVPELMAALSAPAMMQRSWRATLAGDGDLGRFALLAEQGGFSGRITMPGWLDRSAAASLLAQADVLVLPSFHEALPMAVVEALAHGVAVVATPVGAIGELLQDEVSALLVKPGDIAGLTEALVRLIDSQALRARLAAEGNTVFQAELDVAVTARQMFAIFAGAARARGQKAGEARWAR